MQWVVGVRHVPRQHSGGLNDHHIEAREIGLTQQLADPDILPSPAACDDPRYVIYEDLDLLCTRGLLVLIPETHGEHNICVYSEFSVEKALSKQGEERGWHTCTSTESSYHPICISVDRS